MPRYCLDTSGLSNPLENLPEDIYENLWAQVEAILETDALCWNTEIGEELKSINGRIGECIKRRHKDLCFEISVGDWPWAEYLDVVNDFLTRYASVISEYNGNRKNTVGLNDISIIALAKVLGVPVVSMEKENSHQPSDRRMRIPDICRREGIPHLNFNEFLRAEGVRA